MAEAVVEERPQAPQRFYCHLCSVEIDTVTTVIINLSNYIIKLIKNKSGKSVQREEKKRGSTKMK